jgi:Putative Flp pilus-assembly TadE/G-like
MTMRATSREARRRGEGQILVLFILSVSVMIAMAGLLFTGAQTLVLRRQLQNAGDAAALAGANLLIYNQGCSAGGSGGSPRSALVTAVNNSITNNVPGFNTANVTVTCPTGYQNAAIQVAVHGNAPSFFGSAGLNVRTTSVAVNGQAFGGEYSVALLDPSHPTWKAQYNGCPSFSIDGGITATFEGSVLVDSTCTLNINSNGDMKAVNNSATVTMVNGAKIRLAGEYAMPINISPAPTQHWLPLLFDPLAGLVRPCPYGWTAGGCVGTSTTLPAATEGSICSGTNKDPCILTPGTYNDGKGIVAQGTGNIPAVVLLRPGVYHIQGGGFALKSASSRIYAIPASSVLDNASVRTRYASTNDTGCASSNPDCVVGPRWQSDCGISTATCGILIYNAPSGNLAPSASTWSANTDAISVGAQGVVRLRAYNPAADPTNVTLFASYKNLVIWQARQPAPLNNTGFQPDITLAGGGSVTLSGTVYAAAAQVTFYGNSAGCGGCDSNDTLQFICWELSLKGNNNFYFAYRAASFAAPTFYGLMK